MTVQSPCVSCCKLDENDVCMGCYRTMEEIANWSQSDDQYKKAVIEKLEKRATEYQQVDYHSIDKFPITRKKHLEYKY